MASDPFKHVALSAENPFIPDLEDMDDAGLQSLAGHLARTDDVTGTIHFLLSALQERARELKYLNVDPLTGLLNKRGFELILKHETDKNERALFRSGESRLCLIYGDLTGFKAINDTYDHSVGDDALRHVAGIFNEATRATDVVVHFSGDEFGVLLPDCGAAQANQVSERIEEKFKGMPFMQNGQVVPLGINLGLAVHEHGESPKDFIARADAQMKAEKEAYYQQNGLKRRGSTPTEP